MARKFFKNTKQVSKDLPKVLIGAATRTAGAVVASYGTKQLTAAMPKMANIAKPLFAVIGVVGEAFAEDNTIKQLAQGMAVYGGVSTVAALAPTQFANSMGLGSSAATVAIENENRADYWERLAESVDKQTLGEVITENDTDEEYTEDVRISGYDDSSYEDYQEE